MKVYISGPMTGLPDFNKQAFHAAKHYLQSKDYEVISPADVEIPNGTWLDFMRVDIKMLVDCDAIFMLRGWEKSKGASLELTIASALGLKVMVES